MAVRWALAVGLAAGVTFLSKVLFLGWGLGIARLDFTGISGHALLATCLYPVLFSIHAPQDSPRWQRMGFYVGVAVVVAVGVSRIVLGAHSTSEVLSARALGLLVSYGAVGALQGHWPPARVARLSPLLLLLAFNSGAANYLPSHDLEVRFSLAVSWRANPFTRHHGLRSQRTNSQNGVLPAP
jgi:membrane-associated phospholipid phosphatase